MSTADFLWRATSGEAAAYARGYAAGYKAAEPTTDALTLLRRDADALTLRNYLTNTDPGDEQETR